MISYQTLVTKSSRTNPFVTRLIFELTQTKGQIYRLVFCLLWHRRWFTVDMFFSAHRNEEQEAKMGQGRHFHFGTAPTEKMKKKNVGKIVTDNTTDNKTITRSSPTQCKCHKGKIIAASAHFEEILLFAFHFGSRSHNSEQYNRRL